MAEKEELGLEVFVEGWQKFDRIMKKLDKSVDDLEDGMGRTTKAGGAFSVAIGTLAANAVMKIGDVLADVGRKVADFAIDSVGMAADFQSSMAGLSIAASSTGMTFEELKAAALAVGGDTRLLGVSATGAAASMEGLFKAGLTGTEIFGDLNAFMNEGAELGGALRASIDMAAATELDMVQASDLAAIALATFGGELETEAERAARVSEMLDHMVKSADASVAEVGDLAAAMKNVGPAASGLGIPLEDVNTALAILSTRGIVGAEAGTALKSMLVNLNRPTDQVKDALRDLNVSLYDAQGNFVGLPNLVEQLTESLTGSIQVTETIGGRTEEQNKMLEEAEKRYKSLTRRIDNHNAGLNVMSDKALAKANDELATSKKIIGELSAVEGTAITRTKELTEEEKNLAVQTIAGSYGMNALNTLVAAQSTLTEEGVSGWDAMTGSIDEAMGTQEQAAIRAETFNAKMEAMKGIIETVKIGIGDAFLPVATDLTEWFTEMVSEHGPALAEWFGKNLPIAVDAAKKFFKGRLLPALGKVWKFIIDRLIPTIKNVAEWLQTNIPIAIEKVKKYWVDTLKPALKKVWEFIQNNIIPIFESVRDWLATNIPVAIATAKSFLEETLKPALEEVWQFIQDNVIPIFQNVWAWLQEKIPEAITTAKTFWEETLKPALEKVWLFIQDNVIPIIEKVVDWLKINIPEAIEDARKAWEETLKPALEKVWKIIEEDLIPIVEDIWEWMQTKLPEAITGAKGAFISIRDYVVNKLIPGFEDVVDFIKRELTPILAGIAAMILVVVVAAFVAWAAAAWASAIATITALAPILIPLAAIGIAVGLLVKAWEEDFLGMRTAITEFWDEKVKPAFEDVKEWLEVNIPKATEYVSGIWENTLKPALEIVWEFIDENVLPLFEALADFFDTVLTLALTALAGIWENVLKPALEKVWKFIDEKILPIFKKVKEWLEEKLGPATETATPFLEKLEKAFDAVAKAVQWVIDQVKKVTTKLKNLDVPKWMRPGSKTPLELGLLGIASAMREVQALSGQVFAGMPGSIMVGAGGVSPTASPGTQITNNVTNEGDRNEFNLTTQSTMQPGQMAMEFSTMAMRSR